MRMPDFMEQKKMNYEKSKKPINKKKRMIPSQVFYLNI